MRFNWKGLRMFRTLQCDGQAYRPTTFSLPTQLSNSRVENFIITCTLGFAFRQRGFGKALLYAGFSRTVSSTQMKSHFCLRTLNSCLSLRKKSLPWCHHCSRYLSCHKPVCCPSALVAAALGEPQSASKSKKVTSPSWCPECQRKLSVFTAKSL